MNKSSFRVGVVALVAFGLLTFGMTVFPLPKKVLQLATQKLRVILKT